MSKNRTAGQPSPAYLRWTLAITMGLSTWLNVLHAASAHSPTAPYRIEMMVASAIPPLLVPALIELLGREARRGAASQRLFRSAYWTVVVLTLIAFAVSVWAISSLMISWGQPLIVAVAFPVVLDLAAGASTIFLLDRALGEQRSASAADDQPSTTEDTPTAVAATTSQPPFTYPALDPDRHRFMLTTTTDIPVIAADDVVADEPPTTTPALVDEGVAAADQVVDDHQPTADQMVVADSVVAADVAVDVASDHQLPATDPVVDDHRAVADPAPTTDLPTTAVAAAPAPAALHLVPSDDHRAAAVAVADRGVVKADADVIERVLAGLADGLSQRKIAEVVGVDRSTVSRIKATAAELVTAA